MNKKQRLSIFSWLQFIKNYSKVISIVTLVAFLSLTAACSYYKRRTVVTNSDNFASAYKSNKQERYVILHSGDRMWHLSNIILNEDTKEITGSLSDVEYSHTLYSLKANKKSRGYNHSKSKKTLELHFYTNEILNKDNSQFSLPFSSIDKMEVYQTDYGKKVLSILGFTVGSLAVVGIIIAATKSSCPFIYIKDGNSYSFAGELYPGAILPSLERDDYIPLPDFNPQNEEYELKITNELLEVQYTDLAQLIVINHSENNAVLLDQSGKPHTISNKENPKQVLLDNFASAIEPSIKKDNIAYLFDRETPKVNQWNTIVLTFENTHHSKQAKLILSAKNSLWLDLVYGKFNEQFGSYFNQFQKQQHKVPRKKNMQWRDEQGIPLSVYVKSDNEWILVEKINPVGPMAFKDLVIPIDLEKIDNENIEIKLECGFMFWEVDYAAIDFSKDKNIEMQNIDPYSAIDENGQNVTQLVSKEDGKYLIQPNIGNEVTIKYHVKSPKSDEKQSVFLKNRGYYEYIRDYKGKPNFAKLKTFREKGALSKYSKEEYSRFTATKNLSEIVFNHE